MEKVTREQLVNAMNFATDALKSVNKVCDNMTDLIDEKLKKCKGKLMKGGELKGFTLKRYDIAISIFRSFIQLTFVNEDLLSSLKKSDLKFNDDENKDNHYSINYIWQIIKEYRKGKLTILRLLDVVHPLTISEKLVKELNIRLEKPDDIYDFYEYFSFNSLGFTLKQ